MSETQAVAQESNVESETQTEEQGALEDVDSLLNEWEDNADSATESSSKEKSSDEKPGEQSDTDTREAVEYIRELREREVRQQTETDVKEAVGTIKEGLETPLPEELVEGYLYRQAAKDGRFLSAFQSRHKEPEKWKRLVKAMSSELNKSLTSQVDQSATDDRAAVESAVRSASKAPTQSEQLSEKDLATMSDQEFRKLQRSMLGQG